MSFVPINKTEDSTDEANYAISPKKAGFIIGSLFVVVGSLLSVFAGFYPIYVIRQGRDPIWYDSHVSVCGMAAVYIGLIAFVAGEWFLKNWVDPDSCRAEKPLSPLVAILLVASGIIIGPVWMWMDGVFEAYQKLQ